MLDDLWMTGQWRREYHRWPSLKPVTLIACCTKTSARHPVPRRVVWYTWDHQETFSSHSDVSKKLTPLFQLRTKFCSSRIRAPDTGNARKMLLSPLYPQLLHTNPITFFVFFVNWGSFAQANLRLKYDQYLADPWLWKPHPQADTCVGPPRQIKQKAE